MWPGAVLYAMMRMLMGAKPQSGSQVDAGRSAMFTREFEESLLLIHFTEGTT